MDVVVRDHGRGIPLGKIVECVSRINTGAKYNDDVFQFSVGLNGVGTKAVNALSKTFTVASFRDGQFARANFERRVLLIQQKKGADKKAGEHNGTLIEFSPDPEIFKRSEFKEEHVTRRLRMYTYLNAGLKIRYNGTLYHSKNGLLDLLDEDTDNQQDALYASAAPPRENARTGAHAHPAFQRDALFVRQRPVHQRRRDAPERLPRGHPQGGQRFHEEEVRGRRRARRVWSARWPSG